MKRAAMLVVALLVVFGLVGSADAQVGNWSGYSEQGYQVQMRVEILNPAEGAVVTYFGLVAQVDCPWSHTEAVLGMGFGWPNPELVDGEFVLDYLGRQFRANIFGRLVAPSMFMGTIDVDWAALFSVKLGKKSALLAEKCLARSIDWTMTPVSVPPPRAAAVADVEVEVYNEGGRVRVEVTQ